ncbi:hypothetical protein Tco_0903837 [Tanacetum coccineum]
MVSLPIRSVAYCIRESSILMVALFLPVLDCGEFFPSLLVLWESPTMSIPHSRRDHALDVTEIIVSFGSILCSALPLLPLLLFISAIVDPIFLLHCVPISEKPLFLIPHTVTVAMLLLLVAVRCFCFVLLRDYVAYWFNAEDRCNVSSPLGLQDNVLLLTHGYCRTALTTSLAVDRYTMSSSSFIGAVSVGRVSRQGMTLFAALDRNLFKATSLPLSRCICFKLHGEGMFIMAFVFSGFALIPSEFRQLASFFDIAEVLLHPVLETPSFLRPSWPSVSGESLGGSAFCFWFVKSRMQHPSDLSSGSLSVNQKTGVSTSWVLPIPLSTCPALQPTRLHLPLDHLVRLLFAELLLLSQKHRHAYAVFLLGASSNSEACIQGWVILLSRTWASSIIRHSCRVSFLVVIIAIPLAVRNFIIEWMVDATAPKLLMSVLPNMMLYREQLLTTANSIMTIGSFPDSPMVTLRLMTPIG